jgi:NADH:ubiquinone oxidoreductase subunit F (NADH-binding)/(2Fe-2S) ferredoxin
MTIEDLKRLRDQARQTMTAKSHERRAKVTVHMGTCGSAAGAGDVMAALLKEVASLKATDVVVTASSCAGLCSREPMATVDKAGQSPVKYVDLTPEKIARVLKEHVLGGAIVADFALVNGCGRSGVPALKEIPFFSKQKLVVLRNRGLIDPEKIDDYIAAGGYTALPKALTKMTPEQIIQEVKRSGLRGRGGAGFPAGAKWESCRQAALHRHVEPVVICNADEGDPGAFADRAIIESDPHAIVEGMIIGARAIGCREGFVYVRHEYPLARERLLKAVEQARNYSLLGKNILGTGMDFDIEIDQGAGAYVCGESTALMASLEGKVGEPRPKYIHTVEYGYRDQPSNLNNVETWANVPLIIDCGAQWFASMGTGDVSEDPWNGSSGTKVFSLSGTVNNTGIIEVPMGISLREIVFEIGGGMLRGKKFKAVQTGGPSGGFLPESHLDLKVDFDELTRAGSMMGSGGMVVMDEDNCMVDAARYFVDFLAHESCGRCVPCREGLRQMLRILNNIVSGRGQEGDIELLEELCEFLKVAALCALGSSAPNPVMSAIKHFRHEFEAHIRAKQCPALYCPDLVQAASAA